MLLNKETKPNQVILVCKKLALTDLKIRLPINHMYKHLTVSK